jgi:hypothetical protein
MVLSAVRDPLVARRHADQRGHEARRAGDVESWFLARSTRVGMTLAPSGLVVVHVQSPIGVSRLRGRVLQAQPLARADELLPHRKSARTGCVRIVASCAAGCTRRDPEADDSQCLSKPPLLCGSAAPRGPTLRLVSNVVEGSRLEGRPSEALQQRRMTNDERSALLRACGRASSSRLARRGKGHDHLQSVSKSDRAAC